MDTVLQWWIVYILIPVIIGLLWIDRFIHGKTEAAIAVKDQEIANLHQRINAVNKEFSDYKVSAAMLFSTVSAVSEIKRELLGYLERIENKIDRIPLDKQQRH